MTGYFPLDGLLQLSLKPSILEQKFLQVGEVQVGEVLKGTVKKLTDSALFVSISGNVDAVVWPNHYADISLKHPQKRSEEVELESAARASSGSRRRTVSWIGALLCYLSLYMSWDRPRFVYNPAMNRRLTHASGVSPPSDFPFDGHGARRSGLRPVEIGMASANVDCKCTYSSFGLGRS